MWQKMNKKKENLNLHQLILKKKENLIFTKNRNGS